jgi:hypothetical protein
MQKIKQILESDRGKSILIISIVILVGIGSFELGRLSKGKEDNTLKLVYTDLTQNTSLNTSGAQNSSLKSSFTAPTTQSTNKGGFVASKIGSKYYPTGCVYFATEKEAIEKGYTMSSSCD